MKIYAIRFNTVVKKAKLAAGLFTFTDCLYIACSDSFATADRGLNDHRTKVRFALIALFTEKVVNDKHKDVLRWVFGPDNTFDKPLLNFKQPELARLRQFGIPNVVWETPQCIRSKERSDLKPISTTEQEPLLEFLGLSLYSICVLFLRFDFVCVGGEHVHTLRQDKICHSGKCSTAPLQRTLRLCF